MNIVILIERKPKYIHGITLSHIKKSDFKKHSVKHLTNLHKRYINCIIKLKTLWPKWNCSSWAISPLATMFSKVVCCYCIKLRLQVGPSWIDTMHLNNIIWNTNVLSKPFHLPAFILSERESTSILLCLTFFSDYNLESFEYTFQNKNRIWIYEQIWHFGNSIYITRPILYKLISQSAS